MVLRVFLLSDSMIHYHYTPLKALETPTFRSLKQASLIFQPPSGQNLFSIAAQCYLPRPGD